MEGIHTTELLHSTTADYTITTDLLNSTTADYNITTHLTNLSTTDYNITTDGDDKETTKKILIGGGVVIVLVIVIVIAAVLCIVRKAKNKPYDETITVRDEDGEMQLSYCDVSGVKKRTARAENHYTNPHRNTHISITDESYIGPNGETIQLHGDGTQETSIDETAPGHFKAVSLDDEGDDDTVYDNQSQSETASKSNANTDDESWQDSANGSTDPRTNENQDTTPDQNENETDWSQNEMIARILAKHPNTPPVIPKSRLQTPNTAAESSQTSPDAESFYLDMEFTPGQTTIAMETEPEMAHAKGERSATLSTLDSAQFDDTYEIQ